MGGIQSHMEVQLYCFLSLAASTYDIVFVVCLMTTC